MQSSEVERFHYQIPPNISPYPSHFNMIHDNSPAFQWNRLSDPLYNFQISNQIQELNPQSSSGLSRNSTSDEEDDDQQLCLINERKQRRMISNRESARRSRMRKQRHIDELCSQVLWLQNENHQLMQKFNHISQSQEQVIEENALLKEEASKLRKMIHDMQLHSPYPTLSDLEDVSVPYDTSSLRADSSNRTKTNSPDLIH